MVKNSKNSISLKVLVGKFQIWYQNKDKIIANFWQLILRLYKFDKFTFFLNLRFFQNFSVFLQ